MGKNADEEIIKNRHGLIETPDATERMMMRGEVDMVERLLFRFDFHQER